MSKTIFLSGTAFQKIDHSLTTANKLKQLVANTGNMFFDSAVSKQISDVDVLTSWDQVDENVGTIILSMANFISPTTDFSEECEYIERLGVENIVMIGGGAQANDYGEKLTLTKGTDRFIRMLSERGKSIGVRGYYTAELLADMGIHNVRVIGCPSAYYSLRPDFNIQKKAPTGDYKIATHATPAGHYRDALSNLFHFTYTNNAQYVAQSELRFLEFFEANSAENDSVYFEFVYYNDQRASPKTIQEYFRENLRCYFNMEEWINEMRGYDFTIGSRFHGCMAAIQADTPAKVLVFDTRTRELCEYLNIPYSFLKDFDDTVGAEALYDSIDYSLFNKTYPAKYDRYVSFLEENNLDHNLISTNEQGPALFDERLSTKSQIQSEKIRTSNVERVLTEVAGSDVPVNVVTREVTQRIGEGRTKASRRAVENSQQTLPNDKDVLFPSAQESLVYKKVLEDAAEQFAALTGTVQTAEPEQVNSESDD